MTPCFGIDLGTTCTSIALVADGAPRILPVDGSDYLPSVVWFPADRPPVVGRPAVNQLPLDPLRTVRSCKRSMGTDHRYDLGDRSVTPVDVSAEILRAAAHGAESACGVRPERVVVTVPAWFDQAQRGDTRLAVERAGLELVRMINEPTAAALAHAHGRDVRRRALVYDLGGGTFDASLVDQDGPVTEVRASRGDTRLGGDDVDTALCDLVLRRLAEQDPAFREAVDGSRPAQVRLRMGVEQAKRDLSEALSTTLRVPFLAKVGDADRHLEVALDRDDLDEVVAPIVARTLRCVADLLADAQADPAQLDDLLLVGGSTRLPQVWDALRAILGLEGSHAIPPRKAVALGAAIQAAIVDGSRVDGILVDVAPWPLSVGYIARSSSADEDHLLCKVVTPRNAPLPARHAHRFSTQHPLQSQVRVPIFQGAATHPRQNAVLALVELDGLPPAPDGHFGRPLGVEIRHDLDGMIEATVTDELSGRTARVRTAADGEARADLLAWLEADAERAGYRLGGGEDGAAPERSSGTPPAWGPATGDGGEAHRTFAAVEQRAADLPADVVELARNGMTALATDEAAALEAYDALSDRLFALGVYL